MARRKPGEGQTALVTGASAGIGVDLAECFAKDGYDLIRRVRSLKGPASKLRAVALTAFARAEDRQRAALAGFQAHVAKPVEAGELIAIVAKLTGRAES